MKIYLQEVDDIDTKIVGVMNDGTEKCLMVLFGLQSKIWAEQIIKMFEWEKEEPMKKCKSMCSGCYNNFYNNTKSDGCWSYKSARVVKRVSVGTWQQPPYPRIISNVLSCYNKPGTSLLELDDVRIKKEKV